jgi:hypothetical protein
MFIDLYFCCIGKESLSYVGFSQGTAQAFAAFSSNPKLAAKVNLFVALAPSTRVKGIHDTGTLCVIESTTCRDNLMFTVSIFRDEKPHVCSHCLQQAATNLLVVWQEGYVKLFPLLAKSVDLRFVRQID